MASNYSLSFVLFLVSIYYPYIKITIAAEIESTRKREEVIGLPFRIKDLQHNSVAQETWINHDPDNCVTRNILSHNTTPSPVSAVFNRAGRVGDQKGSRTNMNNKYSVIDFKSTSTCMLVMASIVDVLIQFRPLALISIIFAVTEEELIRKNPTVSTTCLEPTSWACDELKSQLCGFKDSSGSHDQVSCHWNIPQTGSGGNLRVPLPVLILIILLVCTPSIICFICSVWIWIKSVNNSGESPSSIPTVRTHDAAMGGPSRPDGRIQSHIIERERIVELGSMEDDYTCPVCHSEFHSNEILRTMPGCQHQFHAHCVERWLCTNNTCPICRTLVDSD